MRNVCGFGKGLGECCRRSWSFCKAEGALVTSASRLTLSCLLLARGESQQADCIQLHFRPWCSPCSQPIATLVLLGGLSTSLFPRLPHAARSHTATTLFEDTQV
jgi:hypothetical protein